MNVSISSFADELVKIAQGTTIRAHGGNIRVPAGYVPTPAGLYQASRKSQYLPMRRLGKSILKSQRETKAGTLGGAALGGMGGYGLMRHLVPKGKLLGGLGKVLGATGGFTLGGVAGGLGGRTVAHKRLMREPALAAMKARPAAA